MKALITGIGGQDGWYLARHLATAGYQVFGTVQPLEMERIGRLQKDVPGLADVFAGDLTDPWFVAGMVRTAQPDEVYNLAAETNVGMSWGMPARYLQVNTLGLLNVLEAVRQSGLRTAVLQAVSNDVWGDQPPPHSEETPLKPLSPYAVSKAASWHVAVAYRSRGFPVYCAVLGNHESPRRGPRFITQLVATAAARIKLGKQEKLTLRCLSDVRDWGHAADFVQAMHLMLQHRTGDYAIGTGEGRMVADLCQAAFEAAGIEDWRAYVQEVGVASSVPVQVVDARRAKHELGWGPQVSFEEMVTEMVEAALERESALPASLP